MKFQNVMKIQTAFVQKTRDGTAQLCWPWKGWKEKLGKWALCKSAGLHIFYNHMLMSVVLYQMPMWYVTLPFTSQFRDLFLFGIHTHWIGCTVALMTDWCLHGGIIWFIEQVWVRKQHRLMLTVCSQFGLYYYVWSWKRCIKCLNLKVLKHKHKILVNLQRRIVV